MMVRNLCEREADLPSNGVFDRQCSYTPILATAAGGERGDE